MILRSKMPSGADSCTASSGSARPDFGGGVGATRASSRTVMPAACSDARISAAAYSAWCGARRRNTMPPPSADTRPATSIWMRDPLTDSRTVTRERRFAFGDRAVVDHERRIGGRRDHLRGRARLGARADADQHQAVVDDQRHARRQLAGRRVLGGVDRLFVARFRVAIGSSAPMRRGSATTAPAMLRTPRRASALAMRVEIAAAERRVAVAAQVDVADDGAVGRRRQARTARCGSASRRPSRISAVVVASTFWFDAGSISVPSRCE